MGVIGNIGGGKKPVSIISGLTNYVIPVGKYGLVTMFAYSSSCGKGTEGTGSGSSANASSDTASQWVVAGTAIASSSSAGGANGSATVTIDGNAALVVKTRILTLPASPASDSIASAGFTVALYDI